MISLLGIKDYIIIALVIILSLSGWMTKRYYDQTVTLKYTNALAKSNIKKLDESIEKQNAAISAMGIDRQSLLKQLEAAREIQIKEVIKYQVITKEINKTPVATTCPAAIVELQNTSKTLYNAWDRRK